MTNKLKVDVYIEGDGKNRGLFLVDQNGVEYHVWALGYGVPVSLVIETEAERMQKEADDKAEREKELKEYTECKQKKDMRPWYRKIFT